MSDRHQRTEKFLAWLAQELRLVREYNLPGAKVCLAPEFTGIAPSVRRRIERELEWVAQGGEDVQNPEEQQ